jgi:hypothetical protein
LVAGTEIGSRTEVVLIREGEQVIVYVDVEPRPSNLD